MKVSNVPEADGSGDGVGNAVAEQGCLLQKLADPRAVATWQIIQYDFYFLSEMTSLFFLRVNDQPLRTKLFILGVIIYKFTNKKSNNIHKRSYWKRKQGC